MNHIMQINGIDTPMIEIGDVRVVTIKQIADLHKSTYQNVMQNFFRNRKHFIEGTDFYEFAELGEKFSSTYGIHASTRLFFTETGYLMLVKSLTDDLAWKVQRILVNSYFKRSITSDLWIILPTLTRWCRKLATKPWGESEILYFVMAKYPYLEQLLKKAKKRSISIDSIEIEEAQDGRA